MKHPGYAPELSLGEGNWRYLKRDELTRAAKRLRRKHSAIQGCFRLRGYAF